MRGSCAAPRIAPIRVLNVGMVEDDESNLVDGDIQSGNAPTRSAVRTVTFRNSSLAVLVDGDVEENCHMRRAASALLCVPARTVPVVLADKQATPCGRRRTMGGWPPVRTEAITGPPSPGP